MQLINYDGNKQADVLNGRFHFRRKKRENQQNDNIKVPRDPTLNYDK